MKKILFIMIILVASLQMTAQRVNAPGGMISINDDGDAYSVYLFDHLYKDNCPLQEAIDLLVDNTIVSCNPRPIQIGIYIVEYNKEYDDYTIWLDERCKNQEGYPMNFEYIEEVMDQIRECLDYDLDHDYDHEYGPENTSYLEGH